MCWLGKFYGKGSRGAWVFRSHAWKASFPHKAAYLFRSIQACASWESSTKAENAIEVDVTGAITATTAGSAAKSG